VCGVGGGGGVGGSGDNEGGTAGVSTPRRGDSRSNLSISVLG